LCSQSCLHYVPTRRSSDLEALQEQIRVSHCQMLPEAHLPAMLAVQQQRDRRMAQQLIAAPKPAMLLAGAFHVRRDLGVPLHLQRSEEHTSELQSRENLVCR